VVAPTSILTLVAPISQSTNETLPIEPPAFWKLQHTQLVVGVGVVVGVFVIVGVGVGVWLASLSQVVTVETTPLPSNVTAYLNEPSMINEYPPGFDVYVGVVKPESLYIINPFVIANVSSMYFVRPVVPAQADNAST
jgi:hypothetical protein